MIFLLCIRMWATVVDFLVGVLADVEAQLHEELLQGLEPCSQQELQLVALTYQDVAYNCLFQCLNHFRQLSLPIYQRVFLEDKLEGFTGHEVYVLPGLVQQLLVQFFEESVDAGFHLGRDELPDAFLHELVQVKDLEDLQLLFVAEGASGELLDQGFLVVEEDAGQELLVEVEREDRRLLGEDLGEEVWQLGEQGEQGGGEGTEELLPVWGDGVRVFLCLVDQIVEIFEEFGLYYLFN